MELCEKLPEEECYRGEEKPKPEPSNCHEFAFDCGNGQCLAGLRLCDYRADCYNAADEIRW
jgi:hypothetical protein